jgi:hypothetical protein
MDSPQDLKIGFVQDYCDIHGRGKRRRGASVEAGVGEVHLRPIDGPYGQRGCIPQYTEGMGWEPPLEPVELRPLPVVSGQGGTLKREALP